MNVLIFAAHPDDVEPQMGGTIAKYTNFGAKVFIVNLTSPTGNVYGAFKKKSKEEIKKIREKEAINAAQSLGAKVIFLDVPQEEVYYSREIVKRFDKILKMIKPDIIFTSWPGDSHHEHRIVSEVSLSTARENKCSVYFYEPIIPSGLTQKQFCPTTYINIEKFIDLKIKSIKFYKSQLKKYPGWVETIKERSKYHAFRFGLKHVERFQVVKQIKFLP